MVAIYGGAGTYSDAMGRDVAYNMVVVGSSDDGAAAEKSYSPLGGGDGPAESSLPQARLFGVWGQRVCGELIRVDSNTATDVARNPKRGDHVGGRYRVVAGGVGVNRGQHEWRVHILKRGRLLIGVATGAVQSDWVRGGGYALWCMCAAADHRPRHLARGKRPEPSPGLDSVDGVRTKPLGTDQQVAFAQQLIHRAAESA